MARIAPEAFFNSPAGNFSFYKMKGVDKPVVRRKGGASKQRIKTDPKFEHTRMLNAEFGGRATMSRFVMRALWPQKPMADHNIAGPINARLIPVQMMDSNEKGQRNILLSQHTEWLEGFSLNRRTHFDSIVRTHVEGSLVPGEELSYVAIPPLTPGINFHPDTRFPLFGFVATVGIVPDHFYHPLGYKPSDRLYSDMVPVVNFSEWYPVKTGAPATAIELPHVFTAPDEHHCTILSVGIRYGVLHYNNQIEQVRDAGAAKILSAK